MINFPWRVEITECYRILVNGERFEGCLQPEVQAGAVLSDEKYLKVDLILDANRTVIIPVGTIEHHGENAIKFEGDNWYFLEKLNNIEFKVLEDKEDHIPDYVYMNATESASLGDINVYTGVGAMIVVTWPSYKATLLGYDPVNKIDADEDMRRDELTDDGN